MTKTAARALPLLWVLLLLGCPAREREDPAAGEERLRARLKEELKAEIARELAQGELQGQEATRAGTALPAPPSPTPERSPAEASAGPAAGAAPLLPPSPGTGHGSGLTATIGDPEDLPPDPAQPPPLRELPQVPVGPPQPRMKLLEATMARSVRERNPVETGTHFAPSADPLYAFAVVANPDGPEGWLRFVWRYRDKPRAEHRVRIGRAPGWRTWSYHVIPRQQSGEWSVEIQTDAGVILRTLQLSIGPAGP